MIEKEALEELQVRAENENLFINFNITANGPGSWLVTQDDNASHLYELKQALNCGLVITNDRGKTEGVHIWIVREDELEVLGKKLAPLLRAGSYESKRRYGFLESARSKWRAYKYREQKRWEKLHPLPS